MNRCELCGSPVLVVGHTTKHYEAVTLTEEKLVEIIYKWKHTWMDVKGTDERDRENYFRRSFGVDANMIHSLAKLIAAGAEPKSREKE